MAMLTPGGDAVCRTTDIMSDAAYGILCKGTDYTGNFVIDEEFLREHHGITDFSSYKCNPDTKDEDLMMDFFLPEKYDQVWFIPANDFFTAPD